MKPQLLVARAIFPQVIERLAEYFDIESNQEDKIFSSDELVSRLQGKFGMICTSSAIVNERLLARTNQLRIISSIAVGYDNFDLPACSKYHVMATNAPDVLSETTADFAWALMMAAARRVTESEHWLRAGEWQKWSYDLFLGADVYGSRLGILGMGRIGQAIARRASGFGMEVLYHNRTRLTADIELAANGARYVDFDTLLKGVDHLIITVPYSPQVHHLIGQNELALMKNTATLVNVARGGVVDDAALIAALSSGKLAAAGLDVFEKEPKLNPDFLGLKNVVLTPHIASASDKTRLAMCQKAADNVIAALRDELPPNLLNPEAFNG